MWGRTEDQHTVSRFHQLHHQQLASIRLENISNRENSGTSSEHKPDRVNLKALFFNANEPVLNRTTERARWMPDCKCELSKSGITFVSEKNELKIPETTYYIRRYLLYSFRSPWGFRLCKAVIY
jgi:hypothetical protein